MDAARPQPAVSVLMPVYNAAGRLRDALESVRRQTFADWECVCADDGSSDGSADILREISGADARFRVLGLRHGGVSAARNALLDAARGEWIFFLDADDALSRDCLETLVKCAEETCADLAWGQYVRAADAAEGDFAAASRTGVRVWSGAGWRRVFGRNYSLSRPAPSKRWFSEVPCQPWNKIVRRSLLDGKRFDETLSRGEDIVFFADVLREAGRIAITAQATYLYRDSPGTLFRTAGSGYAALGDWAAAVCRMAERDRPPYAGGYLARRWILSWLRAVARWGNLRGDAASCRRFADDCRRFADDCRRLRDAFGERLPAVSRLALAVARVFSRR